MAGTTTRDEKMRNGRKFSENADFHEYEIRLTQRLQNNNEAQRRKALKEVDKWLKIRMDSSDGPLRPESFVLWKGLFYALWMADKPLAQEQLAQRISSFVNLTCPSRSMEFFKYGLSILCYEWFGIDQLRLDKFLMFVRRFLRNGLTVVKNAKYSVATIRLFNAALTETVLNNDLIVKQNCMGLTLHLTEIFLEELAKVSEGNLRPDLVPTFLKPFVEFLARSDDSRLTGCVKRYVFRYLLEQSDAGQEYQAKFRAWSQLGYPGGNIGSMRKVKVALDDVDVTAPSEMANGEKVLDPRAGRVDVVLPQISFKPRQICRLLETYRFAKGTSTKSRKAIVSIISLFEKMSHGNYPLGTKEMRLAENDGYSTRLKTATNRLVKFGKEIRPEKRKRNKTEPEEDNGTDNKSAVKVKRRKLEKPTKPREAAKKSKIKKRLAKVPDAELRNKPEPPNYEFSFERESGTWYVYNLQPNAEKTETTVFSENQWDVSAEPPSTPKVIIQSVVILKKPRTPQSAASSSPGAKKVKIDLKLNRSQEIDEHVKQVKSSPGIPFDAERRPSKPLLKRTLTTPIDPFYVARR